MERNVNRFTAAGGPGPLDGGNALHCLTPSAKSHTIGPVGRPAAGSSDQD